MQRLLLAVFAMACLSAQAAETGIELAVTVKAPLAAVWRAWTTSDGVVEFFAPEARVEARPDGAYTIIMDPYAPPGWQGADDMKVLAVDPERLFSFTWNAPPSLPEARRQRTVVILRFAQEGNDTRLTLSHLGWGDSGEWPKARAYFERAWPRVLANLQTRFATGKPQDWTDWREQLRKHHQAAAQAAQPVNR
ncbi:MAG: SRPBCC domain-containing protein [Betaproteobacteria bacterium]|nr:SRPBCC domain-containing protein [Betaproteobacteria bacterium]